MTRRIKNDELSVFSFKEVLTDIYSDTAFSLLFLLIEEISEFKARLSILLAQLLNSVHLLLVYSAHFE